MLRQPAASAPTGFAHNFVSVDRILLRSDGSAVLVDYRWASPLEQMHPEATALCEIIFKRGQRVLVLQQQPVAAASDLFALRYLSGPGWR